MGNMYNIYDIASAFMCVDKYNTMNLLYVVSVNTTNQIIYSSGQNFDKLN